MNKIKSLGIAGAGFMGRQIALHSAFYGYRVSAYDLSGAAIEKAHEENLHAFDWGAYKVESPEQKEGILSRIHYTTHFEAAFKDVDLVIEAIPERIELKREMWSELDRVCPPQAIIGTNSSSMKVSWLEGFTKRPDKVLNIHFAPSIHERNYVEIMGGTKTSPETVAAAEEWVRSINCVPLIAKKEIMGFVVNRLWRVVKKEALKMWAGGYADIEDIDRGWMIMTGMKAGPFGAMDYIGLDVVYDIEMSYYKDSGSPDDMPPEALREKVDRGELGMKTGKGFYDNRDLKYLKPDFLKPRK